MWSIDVQLGSRLALRRSSIKVSTVASNPSDSVFYSPDLDNMAEIMLEEMRAGTASNLFQGCFTLSPIWAKGSHVLDLRPFIEMGLDDGMLNDWDRAQYEASELLKLLINDEYDLAMVRANFLQMAKASLVDRLGQHDP